MKTRLIVYATLFSILTCTSVALANHKADLKGQKQSRETLINRLTQGETITSRGIQYTLLPELRSRKVGALPTQTAPLQSKTAQSFSTIEPSQIIETRGETIFFIASPSASSSSISRSQSHSTIEATDYPVVVNPTTNQFGVVTGDIRTKLQSPDLAQSLASEYQILLKANFEHLGITIFSTSPNQNIIHLEQALRQDPRVLEADIEIIEHFPHPR